MPNPEQLDNTPHPRILSMLGEIKFAPWQCIAELIDNAIDGFLEMKRLGTPIQDPKIFVATGRETVAVTDNGPGMNFELLEKAVRAGWSGQENINSLGLYGMGFNIATAVLGQLTSIRTTRSGDEQYFETEIDLQKKEYGLPRKTSQKSDLSASGTQIRITNIKFEHQANLEKESWVKQHITERLRRVYSTMIRDQHAEPLKFTLIVNNKKVNPWEYCTWPHDWEVYRKSLGLVSPIKEIDENFGTIFRNSKTGETFNDSSQIPESELVVLPQRIYGWIGIQRYCDDKEYGFDLIRNGRKIELNLKDFFTWEGDDLTSQLEYPIDDVRKTSGRIVGELHIDHGRVYYMKDHFERGHISWGHLDKAIRGSEPLTKRANLGFEGANESPLGVLFRTFRRNSPSPDQKWADILCFKENDIAKSWAGEWRRSNAPFLLDSLWKDKLESYDAIAPVEENGPDEVDPEPDPIIDGGVTQDDEVPPGNPPLSSEIVSLTARKALPEYNLSIPSIGASGTSYEAEVYARLDHDDSPWICAATARGVYEISININHPVFNTTTLQIRDAVIIEMAHIIANEEAEQSIRGEAKSFASILTTLRDKFSNTDSLDVASLLKDSDLIRRAITTSLSEGYEPIEQVEIISLLPLPDAEMVRLAVAQGSQHASPIHFVSMRQLSILMGLVPDKMLKAACFNRQWTPDGMEQDGSLLEQYRRNIVQIIQPLLSVLGEFITQANPEPSKAYLSYIRATIARLNELTAS